VTTRSAGAWGAWLSEPGGRQPARSLTSPDHPPPSLQPLPAFSRIPGLILPSRAFSNCLTVVEFLQSYGKVLGFDPAKDVPSLCTLQEGLLGVGAGAGEVQDLLVRLLQAALYDPGLPPYCQVSQPPAPSPTPAPSPARPQPPWGCCGLRTGEPRFWGCCSGCSLLRPAGSRPLATLGALPHPSHCGAWSPAWGTLGLAPAQAQVPGPGFPVRGVRESSLPCFFPAWQTPVGQEGSPQPPPCSAQSLKILGEKVSEISLNRDTVSEILRCFLTAHAAGEDLCNALRTKPFQALPPEKKAAILAFLVNELNSSALIIR